MPDQTRYDAPAWPVIPEGGLLPGQDRERTDSLPASGAWSLSPFHYSVGDTPLPALPERDDIDPQLLKRLRRLRKRPGFALLNDSALLLQAAQLDMDLPPPWPVRSRQCMATLLQRLAGKPLDPDRIFVHLQSPHPWVDDQDRERETLKYSLTELARAMGDYQQLGGLLRSRVLDGPLADLPDMTASELFKQVQDTYWVNEYLADTARFWRRHAHTWQALARVSFLDGLARQLSRKTLSREGYHLALDALGYNGFPDSYQALMTPRPARATQLHLLYLDDEAVPGLLQIRSMTTSHCFIHLPGSGQPVVEYISDNEQHMTRRLLDALNASPAHRQWLYHRQPEHDRPVPIASRLFTGDVFTVLQGASQGCAEDLAQPHGERFVLGPIRHALNLASAVDLWHKRPAVLDHLPAPLAVAAGVMRDWLLKAHGLDLDPLQVFVAYRPGNAPSPLGHVRHAGNRITVPDTRPLNLAQALVSRYQEPVPQGYVDPGGQSWVYHDPSGTGQGSEQQVLPLSAGQLATQIAGLDFLGLMTRHLEHFWQQQQRSIEQTLHGSLVRQALFCLKLGSLQRSGFDAVVRALQPGSTGWTALGFEVRHSILDGVTRQYCASLLILAPAATQRRILYQPGQPRAFVELQDPQALCDYLIHCAADAQWRARVLDYVPRRHRKRLDSLFSYWAGLRQPPPPASILRPWSDALYDPERYLSLEQCLYEHPLQAGPPAAFMRQTLQANSLEDAQLTITTSQQATLRYWSSQLQHLQLLLAPMSFLVTPAAIASLVNELALLGLNIATASLPGPRDKEKRQVLLSLISLGLLGLAPFTVRLFSALGRMTRTSGLPAPAVPARMGSAPARQWLTPSMGARQTRLERFFHTDAMLKRWTMPGYPRFSTLAVHAWKLGRKFLLWTSDRGQARTLVVSTHGYYLPWSKTVKIPNGTEIRTYAPHGQILIDPSLHRVIGQRVSPYALSTGAGNTPALPSLVVTDKLMAGTDLPGRLKNYTLSKYQSLNGETYLDISHIVRNSHLSPLAGQLPATPMDVLTVRNRFGSLPPTLDELFGTLAGQGIHYDRIFLVHCRCSAIHGLSGKAPLYIPPSSPPDLAVTP